MKQRWQIRQATSDDADRLKDCMQSAYKGYLPRMEGKRLPPMDIDYRDEIENYPTWVIDHQGTLVGGLTMMFEDKTASIANIAVHADFQGQGLGAALMNFAENQAREKRYREMRLATHVMLTENLSLYEYLGWQEYDRDDVRVYMRKRI